jgi:hypothetical protein
MEKTALESICAKLTVGEPIGVKTAIGRLLQGDFLSYDGTGLTGILTLSNANNTFCLPSDQIDRIFIAADNDIEDTLSPNFLS